jgi:brefeldin A-resistance guanine nucleotide exchange factor 1
MTNSPDFWSILQTLLLVKSAGAPIFGILEDVAIGNPSAITADNYESTVNLLSRFASAGKPKQIPEQKADPDRRGKTIKAAKSPESELVMRGSRAVSIVSQLTGRVQSLIQQSHLESTEAWATYWSPIFRALVTQCVNPSREIRQQAFTSLQRSLLSPELTSADHKEWTSIFGEVLFPLIRRLLKPEVYQSDPVGMAETRLQAATLLCKVFLHYLVLLSEWEGMLDLWLRILDIMDRLMNSGQGDNLVCLDLSVRASASS